ncbi:MAG: regulatory protein RecX [Candidatus Levybacteria bacterium]|nr:regulatory protein RecX [Candidatus Levybacteria bacterium]
MDEVTPVLAKSLRFLSFRPRSEKEIREYLLGKKKPQKKNFIPPSAEIIDAVVQKLKDMRFLNDREFAVSFVRSRTEYKPKAKAIIKMELKQKGIAAEIIEEVLQSRTENTDDKTIAKQLLIKRKKRYEGMEPNERYQKVGGFLARKGFSYDVIKSVIDEVFGKGV